MKLLSPSEVATFKKIGRKILSGVRSVGFIQFLISILFFILWIDIMLSVGAIFGAALIIFMILPIVWLIKIVQYKSKFSYGAVLSIFIFSFLMNAGQLPYYVQLIWGEKSAIMELFSGCAICELQTNLKLMITALVAISLMHNRRLVQHYDWQVGLFKKALLAGILLYFIPYLIRFFLL